VRSNKDDDDDDDDYYYYNYIPPVNRDGRLTIDQSKVETYRPTLLLLQFEM